MESFVSADPLEVDFPDFLQEPTPGREQAPDSDSPNERRLLADAKGRPNPHRILQLWRDRLTTTLSVDALLDSFLTLIEQDPKTGVTLTPYGFNPMHDFEQYTAHNGYHDLFSQKNSSYREQYLHYPKPDFTHPMDISSFRYLKEIIDLTNHRKIQLIIFINPYHVDYLELLHSLGFWPSFEAWKRALVRLVDEEEKAQPRRSEIRLLDFSGYGAVATEAVPPAGDTASRMRWYWESGHYKSALGDLMIASMFGHDPGFGRPLTPATIDTVLAEIREGRARFIAQRDASLPAAKELR